MPHPALLVFFFCLYGRFVNSQGLTARVLIFGTRGGPNKTEPAVERLAMTFTEVYLGQVTIADFRRNARGPLGTRTATLDRQGILKLRANWIYRLKPGMEDEI